MFQRVALLCILAVTSILYFWPKPAPKVAAVIEEANPELPSSQGWQPEPALLATIAQIPNPQQRELVRYGKELFLHTAYYLGKRGRVARHTNRMNCQNCHLDGGTRKFGNDLTQSVKMYPMYRAREGRVLSLKERINNCVERPLNGVALPMEGREMSALHAYIEWLNTIPLAREVKPGENLMTVKLLERAANPKQGAKVFAQQCARCHGPNGEGLLHTDHISFAYPPLWGDESFSAGSSMTRVMKMAAFIKGNMPYGTSSESPKLTDEEAVDVAAFITRPTHTRPTKRDVFKDYPNQEEKPFDLPTGPFSDPFSAEQHWLGPFEPIQKYYQQRKLILSKK